MKNLFLALAAIAIALTTAAHVGAGVPPAAEGSVFLAGSETVLVACTQCESSLAVSGLSSPGSMNNASNRLLSPNTALVGRDLSVAVEVAPGAGKREFVIMTVPFQTGKTLRCSITGAATTCNSGKQSLAIAPGTLLVMDAINIGNAPATRVTFGWRTTTP